MLRQRQISEAFYEDIEDRTYSGPQLVPPPVGVVGRSMEIKKIHSRQSHRLPPWIWWMLAKLLGIKINPDDKPVLGTIVQTLTVLSAIGFILCFSWVTAADIRNEFTKQTVLLGCVAIIGAIYFTCLGIYANRLAAVLLSNQRFVDSVRLHTRTVFKVSAAGLLIIISVANMVLNNYRTRLLYPGSRCENITLSGSLCHAMFGLKVGYSSFCLLWNLLVGLILLSVCRTHTIGRFIYSMHKVYTYI